MLSIQYRYPQDDWADDSTVTEDELFDGSTFDYYAICVVDQESYDYLTALELVRGERIYDMHHTEDKNQGRIPHVLIRVRGLGQ